MLEYQNISCEGKSCLLYQVVETTLEPSCLLSCSHCCHSYVMCISSPRITHSDIDISTLPRVSDTVVRAALSGSKSVSTDSVDKKCDRCTGVDKMKAVICCTDCKKSFCHQHAEVIYFSHVYVFAEPELILYHVHYLVSITYVA